MRTEWYLAQILFELKRFNGSKDRDWRRNLIGFEPPQQTAEEIHDIFGGMS